MTLKPYDEKLNNSTFSMGISKKVPDSGVNLAFAHSPSIGERNLSIVNNYDNNLVNQDKYSLFYSDTNNKLRKSNGTDFISSGSVEVTDEFSIRRNSNDEIEPLFFKATLSEPIKGLTSTRNIVRESIPYVYGYETKTLEQLSSILDSDDKSDITPLVSVVDIVDSDGLRVEEGFKVRLVRVEDYPSYENDAYQVIIYNSFDRNKTYRVTYRQYDGSIKTEIINSESMFSKLSSLSELDVADPMDKVYALKEGEVISYIYAPTDMYKIGDTARIPHRFRYRIHGNIKERYSDYNKGQLNIGIISFEKGDGTNDSKTIAADFVKSGKFPEYISFKNPHPPAIYYGDYTKYINDPNYWQVDLSMPEDYINDYDLIIITGYGSHDLSGYNDQLASFLEQGGHVLIDNLSNEAAFALDIDFGSEEPVFGYTYAVDGGTGELILNTSPREVNDSEGFFDRYYDLDGVSPSRMALIEDNVQVSPEFQVNTSGSWTDIVRYTTEDKCIGYTEYKDKGRLYFSNSGLTKAFSIGSSEEVQKLMVNLIINLAEEKWVSTPWVNDRIYHLSSLYEKEMEEMGYEYGISLSNKPVAKKVIGSTIDQVFGLYTKYKYYNKDVDYKIEAQEYDSKASSLENEWVVMNKVYMPPELSNGEKLYAYALVDNEGSFNLDDMRGYSESKVNIYSENVEFNYIVRPFTYIWIEVDGSLEKVKLTGAGKNMAELKASVGTADGIKNIAQLSAVIPELPEGTYWAKKRAQLTSDSIESLSSNFIDKKDIFFEVVNGFYRDGEFIEGSQDVSLMIYDKVDGEYKYSNNGDNVISYEDLFSLRKVQTSSGDYVNKRRSEDIYIQASTNKYSLSVNKRIFAVKEKYSSLSEIKLPDSLNSNENWNPRIRYLNFIKNSFTKEDYKKISDTLRFKFDRDYIINTINEYYGSNPTDNRIISTVSKLNNNDELDSEDWQILSEAFDLIDESSLYEYKLEEYNHQAWDPAQPVKKVTNEYAKYINKNTIKVQYENIHVNTNNVVREKLEKLSNTVFRSINKMWLPSEAITIEVEDLDEISGYRVIDPDQYTIDFNKGIVESETYISDSLYATYKYSDLELYKKLYSNSNVKLEECVQLDNYHYDISGISSESRVLKNPSPVVYFADTYSEIEEAIKNGDTSEYVGRSYSIDYDRGFIIMATPTTKRVFIQYTYENVQRLTLKDYDSKNGVIELEETIHFNDKVLATYYYEDEFYNYKGYMGQDRFIYLDMNPNQGHICTLPYVEDNQIKYKDVSTYEVVGKEVYFYMMPYRVLRKSNATDERLSKNSSTEFYIDKEYKVLSDPITIKNSKIVKQLAEPGQDTNFTELITTVDPSAYEVDMETGVVTFNEDVEGSILASYYYYDVVVQNKSTIRHTFDYEELQLIQLAHPEAIILGSMKISTEYSKADITMLDTRVRGGGLKKDVSESEINSTDELSKHFWDISSFSGPTYYGNGITVIKIPKDVLEENGGLFTKRDVDDIVNQHLAYGVKAIIDYY